jgi:hypothetical protein
LFHGGIVVASTAKCKMENPWRQELPR